MGLSQSDASRRALRWAAQRALESKCELRVITATAEPIPMVPLGGCPAPFVSAEALRQQVSQWQASVLDEVLAGMASRPTVSLAVDVGPPDVVLREHSRSAELLVLGNSGRRFRTIERRCLKAAACPVVVVAWDRPK